MRRPFSTVAVLLVAVSVAAGLSACQASSPTPPVAQTAGPAGPPTPVTASTASTGSTGSTTWPTDSAGNPVGWQVCSNAVRHFTIAYPSGWHTASLGAEDACARFDPAAFTVSDGPALDGQQLLAYYESQDALDYLMELFPTDFFTITSQTNVTVAGLHAIRYTVTTLPPRGPAGPSYPPGSTIYGYVVTAGARSVDVATWVAPADAASLTARQRIVDQAVTTVHFTTP
jgi:hypothetical protein